MAEIRQVSIKIEASRSVSLDLSGDMMETRLYSAGGGSLGTVKELFLARWNEGGFPSDAGVHEGLEIVANPVCVLSRGETVRANVYATLEVVQRRFVGTFSPEQAAVLEGRSEEEVAMPDIRLEWQEISASDLAPETQAVFTSVARY